jgi:hypothetical protein
MRLILLYINVNNFNLTNTKRDRKMRNLTSKVHVSEAAFEKERTGRRKNVIFKTKHVLKKRGRYGWRSFVGHFASLTLQLVPSGRTGSVLPWSYPNHRENPINYHKCPTFDAGDFHKTNETKMQMNLRKQIKDTK